MDGTGRWSRGRCDDARSAAGGTGPARAGLGHSGRVMDEPSRILSIGAHPPRPVGHQTGGYAFDVFVDIADVAEKEARRAGRAGQLSATAAPTRASADRDLARRVRAGRGNCAYGEGFISHHPLLPAGDRPRPAHGARLRPRGDGALFVQASGLSFGPTVVAHVLERVRQRHAQAAPALRSPRTYLSSTVAVSAAPLCLRRCAPASYRNSCYYSHIMNCVDVAPADR